jgi:hypothetical protein
MVFGEAKTGSEDSRLADLLKLVPQDETPSNSEAPAPADSSRSTQSAPAQQNSSLARSQPKRGASRPAPAPEPESEATAPADGGAKYPAITAIEQKVLGHDYSAEPIEGRLTRLETKMFGKPSKGEDLSDRVDALKERSGIDIAARPPAGVGGDWMDDDDDDVTQPPARSMPPRHSMPAPVSNAGYGDGQEWGRNIQNDIANFGSGTSTAASAAAKANSNWAPSADDDDSDLPLSVPSAHRTPVNRNARPAPSTVAPSGMGLTQQVSSLETSVLGKTYTGDSLPTRISRLEKEVFPQDKPNITMSLPDRVHKLVAVIGISAPQPAPARVADLNNAMPPTAPSLSNLVNQLGSMMNNGGFTGGYPMSRALVPDPGNPSLMMDPVTGNLINPANGMIVGKRVVQQSQYGNTNPSIPSFGSGFSPIGGNSFGFGGMGVGGRSMTWP